MRAAPARGPSARRRAGPRGGRRAPRRSGAKRSISATQLARSEAGATSRLGRRPAPASRLSTGKQREHLDRLAEAHVVGQAGAEAELAEEVEPAHARPAGTGAERRSQRRRRVDAGEALRPAQAARASRRATAPRRPAPSRDPRPRRRPRPPRGPRPASAAPRRSVTPLAFAARSARAQRRRACCRSRSRSTSTHWPADEGEPVRAREEPRDLVAAEPARRRA